MINSCIREELDLDNCAVRVKVLFSYVGDDNIEKFIERHKKVNLYVYNENKELVDEQIILKSELEKFQGTYLNLKSGNYTIVCWGNHNESLDLIAKESLLKASMQHLDHTSLSGFKTPADSIYHAIYQLNVPKTTTLIKDTLIQDIIPFTRAYTDFQVVVKNINNVLPTITQPSEIGLVFDKLPEITPCNNSETVQIFTDGSCKYTSDFQLSEAGVNYLFTQLRTMRIKNENEILLTLRTHHSLPNTKAVNGNAIYSLSIKDFLKNNNIDVETYNEINIPILIDFSKAIIEDGIIINVSVKPWIGIPIIPIQ